MLRRLRKDQSGFTLMEIVIVIVILGILALLAVPRLIGFTDQAKIANDKEYAAIIAKSAELYWASHNETFTALELVANYSGSTLEEFVDNPTSALQYFDSSMTNRVINISVSKTGAIVSLTSDNTKDLDPGVAKVIISNGETGTALEYIEYSSQYGYTKQPNE